MDDVRVRAKTKKTEKKIIRRMQARLLLVFCVILVLLIALVIRVVYITGQDKYKKGALELQSYVSSEIPCKRGDILDRNGNILATGEIVYNLILDPKVVLYRDAYTEASITALKTVYGFEEAEIRSVLEQKSQSSYVVLKRTLSYDEKKAFSDYVDSLGKASVNVRGIWFEEDYKRVYPFGRLASHAIGFTDSEGKGNYGIEQYYNDTLDGLNGRNYGYYDSTLNIVNTVKPPVDGNTLVSTLDANVQNVLQRYVEEFYSLYGANNVGAVIMDANSGEIYAMQSNHSYDLNSPRDLSFAYSAEEIAGMSDEQKTSALFDMWRNFCISDAYEPGSIYKPFTIASALEEDCVEKDSMWVCDGYEDFPGNVRIRCSNIMGHGHISLAQSVMFSCNDVLMQVARAEGRDVFAKYQKKFGIGQLTGIDLPGEAIGQCFSVSELNDTELATSSFGQGFTATMIQMSSAFSSLINGGVYYEPHIIKRIVSAEGNTLKKIEPVAVRKTISENTADYVKEALYMTVNEGTGTKASVKGYMIGGKTGTSQKLPREAEKYLVSFLGFIESEETDVIIYVVVDECHAEEYYGKCAPAMDIFKKTAEEILPYLKIYPTGEITYKLRTITEDQLTVDPSNEQYDPENNEGAVNVFTR